MSKMHLSIIGTVICGLLAFASPAYAEFLSFNSKSSGDAGGELTFAGGGATVTCIALPSAGPEWSIRNAKGELATTGPELLSKLKKSAECTTEALGVEVHPTTSECEFAVKQTGTEEKVDGTAIDNCTIKAEFGGAVCEVTAEAASNKELKEVTVDVSGLQSKNMILNYELQGVTTSVKGAGCSFAGIKATKEGTVEGAVEASEASIQQGGAWFSLYLPDHPGQPVAFVKNGEKLLVTARWERVPATARPGSALKTAERGGTNNYTISKENLLTCQSREYNGTQPECRMEAELKNRPPAGNVYIIDFSVEWMGITSEVSVIGVR
jgi:hypothetical protein